jgi:hypothetical protein
MNWNDKIESIPYIDKYVNFVIGSLMFFALLQVFSTRSSLCIVAVVAIGKEIFDWYRENYDNVEITDMICVIAGAIISALIYNYL